MKDLANALANKTGEAFNNTIGVGMVSVSNFFSSAYAFFTKPDNVNIPRNHVVDDNTLRPTTLRAEGSPATMPIVSVQESEDMRVDTPARSAQVSSASGTGSTLPHREIVQGAASGLGTMSAPYAGQSGSSRAAAAVVGVVRNLPFGAESDAEVIKTLLNLRPTDHNFTHALATQRNLEYIKADLSR